MLRDDFTPRPAPADDKNAGPEAEADTAEGPGAAEDSGAEAGPAGDAATGTSRTSDIVAGPGGVMTDEVGVITGELTLRSELADGKLTLRVQYREADEWYVVTGGVAALHDPADLDAVHAVVTGILNRPEG